MGILPVPYQSPCLLLKAKFQACTEKPPTSQEDIKRDLHVCHMDSLQKVSTMSSVSGARAIACLPMALITLLLNLLYSRNLSQFLFEICPPKRNKAKPNEAAFHL